MLESSSKVSHWSMDSEVIPHQVQLPNHVYPPVPPPARLAHTQSHPIYHQTYAIGDKVYFDDSDEPYIFLGTTNRVKYDDKGKEEYVAEFWAPYPKYPPPSIHLKLNHRVQHDHIPIPMQPLS